MRRSPRRLQLERLESRSLLAASVGIPDVVLDPAAAEPQVATSIEIDNATGLRAATVEIRYDPQLLQADIASIRAGSIWNGKGLAIANHNDQEGTITAFVFATQHLSLSSGSLLDIDFVFNNNSTEHARANIALASLRLNEGDIPISAVPIHSQTAIDGSITRQTPLSTTPPLPLPTPPLPLTTPTLPVPTPVPILFKPYRPQAASVPHAVPAFAGFASPVLPPPPQQVADDRPGQAADREPGAAVRPPQPRICIPWPRQALFIGPLTADQSGAYDEVLPAPLALSLSGPQPDVNDPDSLQPPSASSAATATAGLAPAVSASPPPNPVAGICDAAERIAAAAPVVQALPVSLPAATPQRRGGFATPLIRLFAGRDTQRPDNVLQDIDQPHFEP